MLISGHCKQEQEMKEKQDFSDAHLAKILGENMINDNFILSDSFIVKVKPSKPKSKIIGMNKNILIIELNAKPIDGEANKELLKFLKEYYKHDFTIVSGLKSKTKKVLKKI
jgi:uncharacterized protein (TIGR00251 family)